MVRSTLLTRCGHRLCAAAFQIIKEQSTYRHDVSRALFDDLVGEITR
jgi:hypothetical protein